MKDDADDAERQHHARRYGGFTSAILTLADQLEAEQRALENEHVAPELAEALAAWRRGDRLGEARCYDRIATAYRKGGFVGMAEQYDTTAKRVRALHHRGQRKAAAK